MIPFAVRVIDRGEKGFYFRWRDESGRIREEATGLHRRRDAERAAAEKERQLRAKAPTGDIEWEAWREIISIEYCSGLALATERQIESTLTRLESSLGGAPAYLSAITPQVLSRHAAAMRRAGRSENTIASHFRTLRGLLAWSVAQGYLSSMPVIPRIARATGTRARGRPLTDAEFDQMLTAVPSVVEPGTGDSWQHFLRGLWLSGLRLSEALRLTWEPSASGIWLDFRNNRARLVIRSHAEKGQRDRLLPLTPDFAEWIGRDGTGRVFRPLVRYGRVTASRDQCSHVISAIGKSAQVETEPGRFATAHDLRRSFCLRWAMIVAPAVLQQLARHASVATTMEFYAHADADRWADQIESAWREKVNCEVNRKTENA